MGLGLMGRDKGTARASGQGRGTAFLPLRPGPGPGCGWADLPGPRELREHLPPDPASGLTTDTCVPPSRTPVPEAYPDPYLQRPTPQRHILTNAHTTHRLPTPVHGHPQ